MSRGLSRSIPATAAGSTSSRRVAKAADRAASGSSPGVRNSWCQSAELLTPRSPRRSAGSNPACNSEDFPDPEDPTTPSKPPAHTPPATGGPQDRLQQRGLPGARGSDPAEQATGPYPSGQRPHQRLGQCVPSEEEAGIVGGK